MEAVSVSKKGKQILITINESSVSKTTIENVLKRLRFEALTKKAAFKKADLEKLKKEVEANWRKYYKPLL